MKKLATNHHGLLAAQHSKSTPPVLLLGLAGLVSLATTPGSSFAADSAYTFKVVTTIGSPAPGGGAFVSDFEPTALNNHGQLAFTADRMCRERRLSFWPAAERFNNSCVSAKVLPAAVLSPSTSLAISA